MKNESIFEKIKNKKSFNLFGYLPLSLIVLIFLSSTILPLNATVIMFVMILSLLLSLVYIVLVISGLIRKAKINTVITVSLVINLLVLAYSLYVSVGFIGSRHLFSGDVRNIRTKSFSQSVDGIITINFAECSKGYAVVYQTLGHTEYNFLGIESGKCKFQSGTEIEDPSWDGRMDTDCSVPVSTGKVSLNEIDLNQYCHEI